MVLELGFSRDWTPEVNIDHAVLVELVGVLLYEVIKF